MDRVALVVVDLQQAFADSEYWGVRNNPSCEANVGALIGAWRAAGQPLVFVRHHSTEDGSPLHPDHPGSRFHDVVEGEPDLLVTKSVHSGFHGDPDLARWLRDERIEKVVICGVQTNMCCETTARVGSDLGFDVSFAIDATHTFDQSDHEGATISADEIARITRANLDPEFCRVVGTEQLIAELQQAAAA